MKHILIALLIISILIPVVTIMLVKKAKHTYKVGTSIEKIGEITNIILSILYVPFQLICFATFGYYVTYLSPWAEVVFWVLWGMPIITHASMIASVMLRKNFSAGLSFAVQFIPILLWLITVILLVSTR